MSVILDTSVWIEYFKGNAEYFDQCQQILKKDKVSTISLIFAELLQGARGNREVEMIKAYYELIPKVEIEELCIQAGEYSQKMKLISKGIGLIDACIITATINSNSKLWTLDKKIITFIDTRYLYKSSFV